MKRRKCMKRLMAAGMPKREATRMVEFLRKNNIPRAGVTLSVYNPPREYGRCSKRRKVYIYALTTEARLATDEAFHDHEEREI